MAAIAGVCRQSPVFVGIFRGFAWRRKKVIAFSSKKTNDANHKTMRRQTRCDEKEKEDGERAEKTGRIKERREGMKEGWKRQRKEKRKKEIK